MFSKSFSAKLGGQMGLFLGASIVTLTELGEFILFLIWVLLKKVKKKQKTAVENLTLDMQ